MFTEMVGWAVDEGADILIGETFYYAEEAYTALKIMKQSGLPSVITIAPMGEKHYERWCFYFRHLQRARTTRWAM